MLRFLSGHPSLYMRPHLSLIAFGLYLFGAGFVVLLQVEMLAALLRVQPPPPNETIFFGVLFVAFGGYYLLNGLAKSIAFARASVIVRSGTILLVSYFVVTGALDPRYLPLIAGDVAGAIWTAFALRREGEAVFDL